MAPRALARGNYQLSRGGRPKDTLQWGRERSLAETDKGRVQVALQLIASMGPRALARGNLRTPDKIGGVSVASMGPRALARGNVRVIASNGSTVQLQWGRERS